MNVSLLQPNFYQPITINKPDLKKKNSSIQSSNNKNINFKAFNYTTGTTLALLKAVKLTNKYFQLKKFERNFINPINKIIEHPEKHIDELPAILNILNKDIPIIKEDLPKMRITALYCFNPYISDDVYENRNIKKESIINIINSNEYDEQDFIDIYKSLPDSYYKSFKEEILGNCLNFQEKQNAAKRNTFLYATNFVLAQAISNKEHQDFITENKEVILKQKRLFSLELLRELKTTKNLAYEFYNTLQTQSDINKFVKTCYNEILCSALNESNYDSSKVAELLNIDKIYAEDIVKDFINLYIAKTFLSSQEVIKLHKQRVKEKFDIPTNGNITNNIIEKQIDEYIKHTDYEEELTAHKERIKKSTNVNEESSEDYLFNQDMWEHGY